MPRPTKPEDVVRGMGFGGTFAGHYFVVLENKGETCRVYSHGCFHEAVEEILTESIVNCKEPDFWYSLSMGENTYESVKGGRLYKP